MKFPQIPNLLTLIFRNYSPERPITARDISTKILPDLEYIANLQKIGDSPTGVTAGTYGNATNVGQFTVDQFGKIDSASNIAITFPAGFITAIGNTSTINLTNTLGTLTADVNNASITYAKIQNVTTNKLLGRVTAGVGSAEEITLGTNLSFTGTTLNVTGIPTVTPAALTKVDDTNVTLTLGGTPATALLQATSLTLGWTGTLADGRIASATNWNTAYTNRITSLTTTGTSGAATLIANTLNIPQYQAAGTYVTSVSGTANRITSTGGTTPIIDISASYVGQSSITTLGTVTSGTWNASVIPLAYGGTNANLTASNGGIFYSTASAGAILSGTATAGLALISGASAAPSWYVPTSGRVIYTTTGGAITSSTGLQFDGTKMGIGGASSTALLEIFDAGAIAMYLVDTSIAHGMTSIVPTNVHSAWQRPGSAGGAFFSGYTVGTAEAMNFWGYQGTGSASNACVDFSALKKNGTSAQAMGATDLAFIFNNGNYPVTPTTLIAILGSGFTGIGTIAPAQLLHVYQTTNATTIGLVENTSSGASGEAVWRVKNNSGDLAELSQFGSGRTAYGLVGSGETMLYSSTSISILSDTAAGIIKFAAGGHVEQMRLTAVGNLKIAGTALRGTTEGTNHLDIFDGTAPVGTLTNGISLYSTSGILSILNSAGVGGQVITNTGTVLTSGQFPIATSSGRLIDSGVTILSIAAGTFTYSAQTANYTLTTSDFTIDATTGTWTATLPTSVAGKMYVIKNSGTGIITANTTGGQLIDGLLTQIIYSGNSMMVMGTGTGYIII